MADDFNTKLEKGTLTIREAVEGVGKSVTTEKGELNKFAKNIEAAGLSLDSPWADVKNNDFLTKLNEVGVEGNFVTFNTVENSLRKKASANDISYPYSDVFGPEGKARSLDLEKSRQARRTKKFKAVPEAATSLTALTEGISVIKDPKVRAAVAFNSLVPLRPGEVAGIKVDDIDFETGSFKESYIRVNKIRNELDLPEVALEILRDAATTARAEGREYIFLDNAADPKKATTGFVNKMTSAMKVKGGITEKFKPFEKSMGRPVAGASDIRKIIPSIIARELGYESEASAIMGHSTFDETIGGLKAITGKHYVSDIITAEGTTAKQALRALQNMYGEVLGLSSLNELPVSMGVTAAGLTSEGSPRLTVIPKSSDIVGTQVSGQLTDADLGLIDELRDERRANLRVSTLKAEKEATALEKELGEIDEDAIRAKVRRDEDVKKIRDDERSILRGKKPTADAPEGPKTPDDLSPGLKEKLARMGIVLGPLKKLLGPVGVGLAALAAKETEAEVTEATGSPTLGGLAGASEFAPVTYSDVKSLAEGRGSPDMFGLTPASRIAAEEQTYPGSTGFVNDDRAPEATPVDKDQGFLSR